MVDLIDRQKIKAKFEPWLNVQGYSEGELNMLKALLYEITVMPPANTVEVVRCKDCKWFNDIGCSIRIVDDSDKPTENDYCSFGEWKDG